MNILIYYVIPIIIVLGVLIFFHELGHFLVAKLSGVKVLKFSLGFGYKLLGKKIGETEYLISTVPLGGYVKLLGENEDESEPVPPEEEARAFHNQHVLTRIAIVAAGPVFNIVLALFLFCSVHMLAGMNVMTTEVGQVRSDSPADKAGILKGDLIVSVDGTKTESWSTIKKLVQSSAGRPMVIVVQRGDDLLSLEVTPEAAVEKNIFGEDIQSALIGIVSAGKYIKIALGPWQAVKEGVRRTWEVIELTCLTIVKLFQGVVPFKTLGGPILIGQLTGEIAKVSFLDLIPFMAVISINLAILNLLPVPILDGGLIVFLLLELILGKPISIRKRDLAQKVGLFLILLLMAVVFYNDFSRLLFK